MAEPRPAPEPFDPRKISASRVENLNQCGVAFRMKYLEGVPEEVSGSAALFGSVVHRALEWWTPDRTQPLLPLMRRAWRDVADGTSVVDFIECYDAMVGDVLRAEKAAAEAFEARSKRPCQAPRMTKHFKDSQAAKAEARMLRDWLPRLESGSPWRFNDRDPLQKLYGESLQLARRYQQRYEHLAPSIYTEFRFDVDWQGYRLTGFIDCIEPLIHPETGEMQGVGVTDYKTYARPSAEQKDWRQKAIYHVAVNDLIGRGAIELPFDLEATPLLVGIDYVRLLTRSYAVMTELDEARLKRELDAYFAIVESRAFLPAEKGRNPDFCSYPSSCCLRCTTAAGGEARPVEVIL